MGMTLRKDWRAGVLLTVGLAANAGVQSSRAQNTTGTSASESADTLTEILVTGTRQTGLQAVNSPSPIQVISPSALEAAAGNPDLMQTLAQLVPSIEAQGFGFDMANQTLQARLKGLSPNHVLVLIDGKRRHTTANIAVDPGTPFQGGASTDLNFIPEAAIDHIEVLTEGAAAQYGSDAIAGVINIILKKRSSGVTLGGTYGANYDGAPTKLPFHENGGTTAVSGNFGFEPTENSYLNVTLEVHNHEYTGRYAPDVRTTSPLNTSTYPGSNMPLATGYPYLNWEQGDPETHTKLAELNAGFDLGDGAELYAFGTYGTKYAASWQNYRLPTVMQYTNPTTGVTTYPFPYGYSPQEADNETDSAATVGIRGVVADWQWDLSSTYGRDRHEQYTLDSANPGIYDSTGNPTPSNYHDGSMTATQWTNNLDVNRDLKVGMASPLNVAFGVEYRRDTFAIESGQPESYLLGGPSSFAGFAPQDASSNARNNYAGYVDLAGKPIDPLRIDLAARYEHFSDFGNATVGKLTGRYDFMPEFALRGTISNGFRAPTLAEEFYSDTGIGSNSTSLQLPPNSAAASVLGLGNLQPEKSQNLTLGVVLRTVPDMIATLDIYQIRIKDRIVATSGALYGTLNGQVISPLVNEVFTEHGVQLGPQVTTTNLLLFTNGINTTTKGADLAFQYGVDSAIGHFDWLINGTYNDTSITHVRSIPSTLTAALAGAPVYNAIALSDLTTASPKYVVNIGAYWTAGKASVNLLEKIYGPSSEQELDNGDNAANTANYYKTTLGVAPITNLDLAYQMTKALKVSIGANNLFNRYPEKLNPNLLAAYNSKYAVLNNDAASAQPYPLFAPFGIDGGFYYVRLSYVFGKD